MFEDIDDCSWQVREVCAKYGHAMYLAQCFETGLVNLLICLKFKDKDEITKFDIDSFMDKNYKKTLGGLIISLRKSMEVPKDLETELDELLKIRNCLAHQYFRVKAIDFTKNDGRQHMLSELESLILKFEKGDKKIDLIVSTISEQYGITDEIISKKVEELLK